MLPSDRYRRHRVHPADYALALVLVVAHLWLLMSTMDMGFTRDEGFYFAAGMAYEGWFEEWEQNREAGHPEDSFTQENIDRHWATNPEHPVLMKTLFGLSWDAFSQDRDWMAPSTAFRFPAAVFAAVLSGMLFLFVMEAFGRRSMAFFAVVALVFMPRYFFHAHLTCFDSPISTMWFATVWAYWRSYHSRLWAVLAGLLFGVALITKLNAFFIPIGLLAHWALTHWRDFGIEGRGLRSRLKLPAIPLAFPAMAILGPLIFYVGWPRHWFDTFNRIMWYIGRHVHHEHYFVEYFGEGLIRPPFPWEFPIVMTLITVPVVTLAAAALGTFYLGREGWARRARSTPASARDVRGTGLLIAINIIWPIAVIAKPDTPVFGGTKHWMQAMPYLTAVAAVGAVTAFDTLWRALRPAPPTLAHAGRGGRVAHAVALAAFLGVVSVPSVVETLHIHPNGTAYYNELIGGPRGAADAHLMRQFWGYSTRQGLEYLNSVAPERARVFAHNANGDSMRQYRADGLMRDDLRESYDMGSSEFLFFNHQRAFTTVTAPPGSLVDMWERAETRAPLRVWSIDGVPVLSLYVTPEWQRSLGVLGPGAEDAPAEGDSEEPAE
jgi:hypothetical protein